MWFVYSLFFAFWTSIGIIILKHITKGFKPASLAITVNIFTIPFMVILVLLFFRIPEVSLNFFKFVLMSSVLDATAAILYFKALTISPVSLISPISSFNPVFTLVFALILLGETPTPVKFLGILVIVAGSYLLNISSIKQGILRPFKDLYTHRGVQLFLIVNLIWGFTPILQKQAIFETLPVTPIFPSLIGAIIVTLFLFPFAFREKVPDASFKKYAKWFLILGPFTALATLAAFTAFSLTNLSYVTAIFKLSTLFTVILGALFFKETNIKERFAGAAVMVSGTFLLVL